ncbi:MAG: tRNA(Ile)-lysidine synthetase (EC [uncultured Sulfurovum sp.]|uniref:tRNA(Ile)-lysidine synthase n=1 Tax=uncultured Sulfurovum sp. TaxID=269237 RepID=A0A6S6TY82_9BACT|nr:MAG: tRNA(Ile)-lysidine synthetase (EC [uncultured Sulfurovum sp.]CAA6823107.1 MAG: tRNA(Ile)-lysidine synthetase (EC [uncultured Sulfurovum sp.]
MEPLLKLSKKTLSPLEGKKNLLAFSAGVDSSALFFLLIQHNILFDIALVNYNLREESKEEEVYALHLAQKHTLKAHIKQAPYFKNNFEKNARDFRYAFFDELMTNYDNLLTAHQLNDQLEWFLMRLSKGAGTSELLGLEAISRRKEYRVIRPLLQQAKDELENYLKKNNHKYFIDASNTDEKYERNRFRKNFSDKLIEDYKEGIKRSFGYLKKDKKVLARGVEELFHEKEFYVLSYTEEHQIVRLVDKYLKKLGYLLSGQQRVELKKETSLVFGGLWAVEIEAKNIFIAPYKNITMPKTFKEECRKRKIPSKIRKYLYEEEIEIRFLGI